MWYNDFCFKNITLDAAWKRFLTVKVPWHKMSGSNNGDSSGQMWNIFHRWNFQNLDYDGEEKGKKFS